MICAVHKYLIVRVKTYPFTLLTNASMARVEGMVENLADFGVPYAPMSTYI